MRLVAPQVSRKIGETGLLTTKDLTDAKTLVGLTQRGPNSRHICGSVMNPDPDRVDAPYDPTVQIDPLDTAASK